MLNLAEPTDPAWLARALSNLDAILLDHAHCEKKAAGSAVKLLFRYPDQGFLQEPLAALAREELEHFSAVLARLEARGQRFERQRPSTYGGRLHQGVRGREPDHLLDLLLVSALIEARSCERFQLLAAGLEPVDAELAGFYRALLASEARHHGVYVGLAAQLVPEAELRARLEELAKHEAEILRAETRDVRLHS